MDEADIDCALMIWCVAQVRPNNCSLASDEADIDSAIQYYGGPSSHRTHVVLSSLRGEIVFGALDASFSLPYCNQC
jgi:hypothetical protein